MTKKPERTCIVCRKKGTKDNFIKVVKNKDNKFSIQKDERLDGRGAYICKSETCVCNCKKLKSLSRVFKQPVPVEFYEELINEFKSIK